MITLYRIIDTDDNSIVAEGMSYAQAQETVQFYTQDNPNTVFEIEDHGIGIPEKDMPNIFTRYYRAENVLNRPGTGIGLNIVKTHLENLGGEIKIDSVENQGTLVTLQIPNNAKHD